MGRERRVLVAGDHTWLGTRHAAIVGTLSAPDKLRLGIVVYPVGIALVRHGFITTLMQPSSLSRKDL
jgi:hypothetical protein